MQHNAMEEEKREDGKTHLSHVSGASASRHPRRLGRSLSFFCFRRRLRGAPSCSGDDRLFAKTQALHHGLVPFDVFQSQHFVVAQPGLASRASAAHDELWCLFFACSGLDPETKCNESFQVAEQQQQLSTKNISAGKSKKWLVGKA